MRKLTVILLVVLMCATSFAGDKLKGTTTLKDLQPTGNTDKNRKNQQYDLLFTDTGKKYTCLTTDKIRATDFVVGSDLKFEIGGDKAKLKNAHGKELKCTIVRVENLSATGK